MLTCICYLYMLLSMLYALQNLYYYGPFEIELEIGCFENSFALQNFNTTIQNHT